MTTFTVHEPPLRDGESSADPERVRFVRDGFYFWAFLLGPIWLLWRRLWLVLVLYVAVWIGIEAGLWYFGIGVTAQFLVGMLFALLLGLEASTLHRWTLSRRGWKTAGVVVGDDIESAERRFFSTPGRAGSGASVPAKPVTLTSYGPKSQDTEVIGLFPEPGGQR